MRTLLAFTGGVDSSYLLWLEANRAVPDDSIHCMYVDFSKISPVDVDFFKAERFAANAVIDEIDKIFPVTFEIVDDPQWDRSDPDHGTARGWRDRCIRQVASRKMASFDRFITGRTPEGLRTPGYLERIELNQRWWSKRCPGTTWELPLIQKWEGRPHAIAHLPLSIWSLVLACNAPDSIGRECGQCYKCQMTSVSKTLLRSGASPAVALDIILRRRKAGPYIDSLLSGYKELGAGDPGAQIPEMLREDME